MQLISMVHEVVVADYFGDIAYCIRDSVACHSCSCQVQGQECCGLTSRRTGGKCALQQNLNNSALLHHRASDLAQASPSVQQNVKKVTRSNEQHFTSHRIAS
jgi:hypothetical protein